MPYYAELTQLAARAPEVVTYIPAISRPAVAKNADWRGATGRVSELVASYVDRFACDPRSTHFYACGHPAMVRTVKQYGKHHGFRVQTERYWKA